MLIGNPPDGGDNDGNNAGNGGDNGNNGGNNGGNNDGNAGGNNKRVLLAANVQDASSKTGQEGTPVSGQANSLQ